MKRLLIILTAGLLLSSVICNGALTAQARIYCWSLRFQQGHGTGGVTLDLTTLSSGFNGELAPYDQYSQWSWYELYYPYFLDMTGTIFVDIPSTDANGNGFDDFFEVSQGVSATTSGSYSDDYGIGGGTVTATWNRAAGSKDGTCVFNLYDDTYGDLGDYTCPFELIEYTGPLSYTPGSNTVTGSVNLTQTGNAGNYFRGPIAFTKSPTDRFNLLQLQTGAWTNALSQSLSYTNNWFSRDLPWFTNYYGLVKFADGDPTTGGADYRYWVLSIDDLNDSDHDGIPNFSDDPRRPVLTLTRGSTNLLLKISGDVGWPHDIQSVTNVASTNWQAVTSLTLTNDPQTVSLSIPTGPKFWRARAH